MLKRGFTMIELMVAMGLLAVVLLFVFQTFSYQHSTYTVVDKVSEAHQTVQGAARLIERDVRNAGYMVPPAAASCGVDNDDAADVLFVSDTDAIQPADLLPIELASEELGAIADGADDPTAAGVKAMSVDKIVLDELATYDTDADGTNDSDFRVGGGAILIARGAAARGVACGLVTAVDIIAPYEVTVNFLDVLDGAGGELVLVPAHAYRVVGGPPPQLERDGNLLAKDVEDLQVAWFYDDDRNEAVDTDEVRGVTGNDLDTQDVDGNTLRELRINLVTRTSSDDPRNPTDAGAGQVLENRDPTTVPGEDGRHRRVHTSTVYLRNLALR